MRGASCNEEGRSPGVTPSVPSETEITGCCVNSYKLSASPCLPLQLGPASDLALVAVCPSCPAPPHRYRVVVRAAGAKGSVASEPHRVWAQARVMPSRLAATSSALVNTTVAFQCRINFGTDVAYLWDFGDGTAGLGNSSASHVYTR